MKTNWSILKPIRAHSGYHSHETTYGGLQLSVINCGRSSVMGCGFQMWIVKMLSMCCFNWKQTTGIDELIMLGPTLGLGTVDYDL